MNIIEIRSDKIYKKIMDAPINKKEDIYRYELMKPFEFKWKCMNVPIVARQKGGYDVIIASEMLGFYRLRILMKSKKEYKCVIC